MTQVPAASIRNSLHVATMLFTVLEQLMKHRLTDIGLKKLLDDWAKSGAKI